MFFDFFGYVKSKSFVTYIHAHIYIMVSFFPYCAITVTINGINMAERQR